MTFIKDARLSVDRQTTRTEDKSGTSTDLPRDPLEKLAIPFITLSKGVCSNQDLPSILNLGPGCIEKCLSEHRPFVFASIVSLNGNSRCKLCELSTPVLQGRRPNAM